MTNIATGHWFLLHSELDAVTEDPSFTDRALIDEVIRVTTTLCEAGFDVLDIRSPGLDELEVLFDWDRVFSALLTTSEPVDSGLGVWLPSRIEVKQLPGGEVHVRLGDPDVFITLPDLEGLDEAVTDAEEHLGEVLCSLQRPRSSWRSRASQPRAADYPTLGAA